MDTVTYFYSENGTIYAETVSMSRFVLEALPKPFCRVTIHASQTRLDYLGVPQEFIDFQNPFIKPRFSVKYDGAETKKCYYMLEHLEDDPRFYVTMQVLKTFNMLRHIPCVMVLPAEMIPSSKMCANENVSFIPFQENMIIDNPSLVIGQGNVLIESVFLNIPAIVAGKRGLGGIVDDESLEDFIQFKFEGRHGGYLEEQIPPQLLRYLIEELIKDNQSTTGVPSLNGKSMDLIREIYNKLSLEVYVTTKSKEISELENRILRADRSLKPTVCKTFRINNLNKEDTLILNTLNEQIIAAVESEAAEIIKMCVGTMNVEEILAKYPMDERQEVYDFIKDLYTEKVIYFGS